MKKNVIFLIGNGFNYFISNYYANTLEKDNVLEKMKKYLKHNPDEVEVVFESICAMLDEYKTLLSFLSIDSYKNEGEDLIEKLNDLFLQLDDNLQDSFIDSVKEKIKIQMDGSLNDEIMQTESACKLIARTMYGSEKHPLMYVVETKLEDVELDVTLVTTNYDGISEKVFDPFITKHKTKYQSLAIHGTYQDESLICHSPQNKKTQIEFNVELSRRFHDFEKSLEKADVLFIFGNSLSSDPHILEILNQNPVHKVIILDRNPYNYLGQYIEQPFVYLAKEIVSVPTAKTEEAPGDYSVVDTPEKLVELIISSI